MAALSNSFSTGWPSTLVNGNYYLSHEVPKLYFLINIFYKSPEYFLITYVLFFITIYKSKLFFKEKFIFFNYKICFVTIILFFPILVSIFIPFPLYDGTRLFLWVLPYYSIIPGLFIYYLLENFEYKKSKLILSFLFVLIFYFLFNFFTITPYQYTYLNIFNGKQENRYQKFENDYWGVSIKELIKKTDFKKNKNLNISVCGINSGVTKKYLKNESILFNKFVSPKKSDYIIMTNRVTFRGEKAEYSRNMINCFDKYKGTDFSKVTRNGLVLSVIRKIKSE